MQNVLKCSILFLLLTFVGMAVVPAQGRDMSARVGRVERDGGRNEVGGASSIPLILLLSESCEIVPGCSHMAPDSKMYLVLYYLLRSHKNNAVVSECTRRGCYFHPYSTLGKTKYYVFALREIIV